MSVTAVKTENTLGATLLIAGCCVGAGMIGMPVVSASAGFIPSTLAMLLCYLFATLSGLLILEATLWFDQRVNLPTLAQFALGKVGKLLSYALFLFLFYCLFVAYIDSGGQFFAAMLSSSREVGIAVFVSCIGLLTYAGTTVVDHVNRILIIGLGAFYLALISLGVSEVKASNFAHINFPASLGAMPIFLVCFGYQNLVPSLTYYLRKNVGALRLAIFVGNLIPLILYLIWNFVILGMMQDPHAIRQEGAEFVTDLLKGATQSNAIHFFVQSFCLLAVITSFLPNAISFVDFLKDGIKNSLVIFGLIFIPPTLCSLSYPHVFLKALGLAGGFADVLLLGILPALIVYVGRYKKGIRAAYQVPGGKVTLFGVIAFCIFILLIRS